jgi:hypothetical protein
VAISVEFIVRRNGKFRQIAKADGEFAFNMEDEVSIRVVGPSSGSTNIMWVDSAGKVYALHPEPDPVLEIEAVKPRRDSLTSEVVVPEDKMLVIDSGEGIETCVVLWSSGRSKLSPIAVKKLHSALEGAASERRVGRAKWITRLLKSKSNVESHKETVRLGAPRDEEPWIDKLAQELEGIADKVVVANVPNLKP